MDVSSTLKTVLDVAIAVPLTLATALLWLLALRRIVPFARDKRLRSDLFIFFACGFLSIPVIAAFNATIAPIGYARVANLAGEVWNMVVVVGIAEEFSKWLIFAVLMQYLRPLRSPEDGVILAAAVGLAFATAENVVYVGRYGLSVLMVRSFTGTVGHMTYGALWGFVWSAITWETGGRISRQQVPVALSAVTGVAVLHGLYNTSVYFGLTVGVGVEFIVLLLSVHAYRHLMAHSPYRPYSYRRSRRAATDLRTALTNHPRSVVLRRRLGMHCLRLRDYAAAEQQFRRAQLQQGGSSVALDFLIELAVYAQNRTDEGTRRLRVMLGTMPAGMQRAFRRQLPEVLPGDDPVGLVVRGLVGVPRRWALPYRGEWQSDRGARPATSPSANRS